MFYNLSQTSSKQAVTDDLGGSRLSICLKSIKGIGKDLQLDPWQEKKEMLLFFFSSEFFFKNENSFNLK